MLGVLRICTLHLLCQHGTRWLWPYLGLVLPLWHQVALQLLPCQVPLQLTGLLKSTVLYCPRWQHWEIGSPSLLLYLQWKVLYIRKQV